MSKMTEKSLLKVQTRVLAMVLDNEGKASLWLDSGAIAFVYGSSPLLHNIWPKER